MVDNTIFGEMQPKWLLGTDHRGYEAALSGKWIGERPVISYPAVNVLLPERRVLTLDAGSLLLGAGLVAVLWFLTKKR